MMGDQTIIIFKNHTVKDKNLIGNSCTLQSLIEICDAFQCCALKVEHQKNFNFEWDNLHYVDILDIYLQRLICAIDFWEIKKHSQLFNGTQSAG